MAWKPPLGPRLLLRGEKHPLCSRPRWRPVQAQALGCYRPFLRGSHLRPQPGAVAVALVEARSARPLPSQLGSVEVAAAHWAARLRGRLPRWRSRDLVVDWPHSGAAHCLYRGKNHPNWLQPKWHSWRAPHAQTMQYPCGRGLRSSTLHAHKCSRA